MPEIARAVNAQVLSLNDAPQGYEALDSGVARNFVLDPHDLISR
jgi:glutathione-independent formaldehyde dehydrogenase